MKYRVEIKRSAEKELDALRGHFFDRIRDKILSLEEIPRPFGVQKLHGRDAHRVRVGDYRILYTVDDDAKLVEIASVLHRREAYR